MSEGWSVSQKEAIREQLDSLLSKGRLTDVDVRETETTYGEVDSYGQFTTTTIDIGRTKESQMFRDKILDETLEALEAITKGDEQ
jgi:hypothetical protein